MKVSDDVKLSSGRTIAHTREHNGAQLAMPTDGPDAMTHDEWEEYCLISRKRAEAKGHTYVRGR